MSVDVPLKFSFVFVLYRQRNEVIKVIPKVERVNVGPQALRALGLNVEVSSLL